MDKIAVVTIAIGDLYTEMASITHPAIKNYAAKIGADFIVWSDTGGYTLPHYRKLDIGSLLDQYDRVLYIDTDIIVRDDAPDLFNIVPKDCVGIYEEGKYQGDRFNQFKDFCLSAGYDFARWKKKYYNTGVMLVSKQHKNIFERPQSETNHFFEQSYLNAMIDYTDTNVFELDHKFNRMPWLDQFIPAERFASYFVHYAGLSLHMPKDQLLLTIRNDIKIWKENGPKHHYWDKDDKKLLLPSYMVPSYRIQKAISNGVKDNWLFVVGGGIGDEICAEPTARYITEKWPYIRLTVLSFNPDLFSHLKLEANLNHDDNPRIEWDKYLRFDTMPKTDSLQWDFVNHFMVNPVDFVSLITLRRQLPLEYRQPKISFKRPNDSITAELSAYGRKVLVHAGSHWQTKTYSSEFWNSVIRELKNKGFKPVLVGKLPAQDDVTTVDINADGCIDLRSKLSLLEFSWLTKNIDKLITNDSMPLHMAAAHDGKIAVITTCKHPDNIKHWRRSGEHWAYGHNMKFFQKGGMWDIQDDCIVQDKEINANETNPENLSAWIPDPKDIVDWLD